MRHRCLYANLRVEYSLMRVSEISQFRGSAGWYGHVMVKRTSFVGLFWTLDVVHDYYMDQTYKWK